jgi:hypothetical protein
MGPCVWAIAVKKCFSSNTACASSTSSSSAGTRCGEDKLSLDSLTPFAVIDNFIGDASLVDEARSELTAMFNSQQCFRTAEQLASIQNDELYWLPTESADYQNRNFSAPLVQVIEALTGL